MTDPEYKLTRTYINHTDNAQVTVELTTPNRNPDELKQKVDKKASSILNYNTVGDLFSDWDGKGVHYGWGNAPWGENELLNDLEAIDGIRQVRTLPTLDVTSPPTATLDTTDDPETVIDRVNTYFGGFNPEIDNEGNIKIYPSPFTGPGTTPRNFSESQEDASA